MAFILLLIPAEPAGAQPTQIGMSWVAFPSQLTDPAANEVMLNALLARPSGVGPFPALVLLHGCGGLLTATRALVSRYRAWAELLLADGYVVLLVDSFNSRGFREECTRSPQPVSSSTDRPADARGALAYLQSQDFVDGDRAGLVGWSHGGASTLATVVGPLDGQSDQSSSESDTEGGARFRTAIAFYPGCRAAAAPRRVASSVPLLILVGEADDWTPVGPCRTLLTRAAESPEPLTLKTYPGAYHAFDDPNTPVHVRTDVRAAAQTGGVHLGTDPDARADALLTVPAFLGRYLKPGPAAE
ncbi:MAG: dienelactone hydrolase family protein [Chloroflexi bacterium]|nr:dienelactone hydrolase family protein [Chloroflexota bacterium]